MVNDSDFFDMVAYEDDLRHREKVFTIFQTEFLPGFFITCWGRYQNNSFFWNTVSLNIKDI